MLIFNLHFQIALGRVERKNGGHVEWSTEICSTTTEKDSAKSACPAGRCCYGHAAVAVRPGSAVQQGSKRPAKGVRLEDLGLEPTRKSTTEDRERLKSWTVHSKFTPKFCLQKKADEKIDVLSLYGSSRCSCKSKLSFVFFTGGLLAMIRPTSFWWKNNQPKNRMWIHFRIYCYEGGIRPGIFWIPSNYCSLTMRENL